MFSGRFRLADHAVADLEGIASQIGERNPTAAERVLNTLYETFAFLGENPDAGTSRDDVLSNLRIFSPPRPANSYVAAFYKTAFGVEISAVIHGSRDWPTLIVTGDR